MISLRRNVLIFHQAALGDFVLTWPIAMAAARLWPTQRVIYVTTPSKGELSERAIGVEWRDGDPWHALYKPNVASSELTPAASKSLAGATLILSFVSTIGDAWSQNICRLAPDAQLICITPRPDREIDRHLTVFHAEQLAERPDLQAATSQMLRHIAAAGAVPRRAGGDSILIHPGSGGEAKRWPPERFAAVGKALRDSGHAVRFVIGEAEHESLRGSELDAFRAAGGLIQPRSLLELFESLQRSLLFLGNDSGPTHLAALLGLPTLALFGRDNDVTWRPLGPGVHLLKRPTVDAIEVNEVVAAILQMQTATPLESVSVSHED